jgi:hypothetical protein
MEPCDGVSDKSKKKKPRGGEHHRG